jgi:hypothetical protein
MTNLIVRGYRRGWFIRVAEQVQRLPDCCPRRNTAAHTPAIGVMECRLTIILVVISIQEQIVAYRFAFLYIKLRFPTLGLATRGKFVTS